MMTHVTDQIAQAFVGAAEAQRRQAQTEIDVLQMRLDALRLALQQGVRPSASVGGDLNIVASAVTIQRRVDAWMTRSEAVNIVTTATARDTVL